MSSLVRATPLFLSTRLSRLARFSPKSIRGLPNRKHLFAASSSSSSSPSISPSPSPPPPPPETLAPNNLILDPGNSKSPLKWISRTDCCGDLAVEDVGRRVRLCGWVALHRVHGGLTFLNLRDRSGIVQITTHPDEFPDAYSVVNKLRLEYVVAVEGVVRSRPGESVNVKMKTGAVEVGMDALDIEKWKFASNSPGKSICLSSILLGLVLIGRAAFVFPLSFLSNLSKRNPQDKISFNQQVAIWWSGLMRGAVSIALAYNKFSRSDNQQPSHAIMITSTITVVLFSTVVLGMMTKPLMRWLLPGRQLSTSSEPSSSFFESLLGNAQGSEIGAVESFPSPTGFHMLFAAPSRTVHRYWRMFDDAFMLPMFGGRGFVPFVPGSPIERSVHIGSEPQDTES